IASTKYSSLRQRNDCTEACFVVMILEALPKHGESEFARTVSRRDPLHPEFVAEHQSHAPHLRFRRENEMKATHDGVQMGIDLGSRRENVFHARMRATDNHSESFWGLHGEREFIHIK